MYQDGLKGSVIITPDNILINEVCLLEWQEERWFYIALKESDN